MLKCENTEIMNFQGALRGMRNPMNSWNKSDSGYFPVQQPPCNDVTIEYVIGENDLKLAQKLIRSGSEHRKFMRQIFVCVDITAPLYWWKEFDTYKVGTVANSCSTMHKIHEKEFTLDDFLHEHIEEDVFIVGNDKLDISMSVLHQIIRVLNCARAYFIHTGDKKYWWQMIQLLPSSYNQKRTITLSYENLFAMCSKGQRKFHKLDEWSKDFISWARTLPYAQELIFIDELDKRKKYENN